MSHICFKNKNISVIALSLDTLDLNLLAAELEERLKQSPVGFFAAQAVVVDLNALPKPSREVLQDLQHLFLRHRLNLIGVEHRDLRTTDLLGTNLNLIRHALERPSKTPVPVLPPPALATRIVESTVRGGMDIGADGGDLVVLGSVNDAATVRADGSIYIFGVLRGGAWAGARGNRSSVIYCRGLSAEFISIGDRTLERRDLQNFAQKHRYVFGEGFFRLNGQNQMEFLDQAKQLKITLN